MAPNRTPARRIALLTIALSLGSLMAGCAGSGSHSRATYLNDYERGRYSAASTGAIRALRDPGAPDRDVARLTAGLSAHELGRNDEATVWLRALTRNEDPVIAGKALAAIGMIALDEQEYQTAAPALSQASQKLDGDDAAKAALYAGDAFAAMGNIRKAREHYRIAEITGSSHKLRNDSASRIGKGYTLQLGAFADKSNAERSRRQVEQDRAFRSLGQPIVSERTNNRGDTLYLVQVGRFGSVRDAKAAQLRTGIGGIVTMSAARAHTG